MVAGMKMRDNNPGIADLSDPNRPEKLAEQFREIYDNAWTNLLDYITDNTDATDDIAVQQIVTATQVRHCNHTSLNYTMVKLCVLPVRCINVL